MCNGFVQGYALEFIDFSTRWQGALATIIDREGAEVRKFENIDNFRKKPLSYKIFLKIITFKRKS